MKNRVLILGIDGYIGYALAQYLLDHGYEVCGLDNHSRRKFVEQTGSNSITPIISTTQRGQFLTKHDKFCDRPSIVNVQDFYVMRRVLHEYQPTTIVHLAEQPSAPWSMKNPHTSIDTAHSNVLGTLTLLWAMREATPFAKLIKLGTMGEYGTPKCDIPEGYIPRQPCDYGAPSDDCPMEGLLFPRQPASLYHSTKVADTYNVHFACRNWGLKAVDIQQGVVFGQHQYNYESQRYTRFDYDQYFGTIINRFVAQALAGHPLTVYGTGMQQRGFLPLRESLKCIHLLIEDKITEGQYKSVNQFAETYHLVELARIVKETAAEQGISAKIEHIPNPRIEDEEHHYKVDTSNLRDLGYKPRIGLKSEISRMLTFLEPFKDRIKWDVIKPTTTWK